MTQRFSEIASDRQLATSRDFDRLDGVLFDLDTYAHHTYKQVTARTFNSSDDHLLDERIFPPFEVQVWHQEDRLFGAQDSQINQGISLCLIENDEEGESINTADDNNSIEHQLAVFAMKHRLDGWNRILPEVEEGWLKRLWDMAEDPEVAGMRADELIHSTPYSTELMVFSQLSLKHSTNTLNYKKIVGNEAYQQVFSGTDREIGTRLTVRNKTDEGTFVYDYKQGHEGTRSLDIVKCAGDDTQTMLGNTALTSGKVYRFCNIVEELLVLSFGPAKNPFI